MRNAGWSGSNQPLGGATVEGSFYSDEISREFGVTCDVRTRANGACACGGQLLICMSVTWQVLSRVRWFGPCNVDVVVVGINTPSPPLYTHQAHVGIIPLTSTAKVSTSQHHINNFIITLCFSLSLSMLHLIVLTEKRQLHVIFFLQKGKC